MKSGFLAAILLVVSSFFIASCGGRGVPTPKPRSFPKIEFPEKSYIDFDADYCSFVFQRL